MSEDAGRSVVVITRFECHSYKLLFVVLALHLHVKREIRRVAPGYLGGTRMVRWKRRTLLNVSFWRDFDSVYAMGMAKSHVAASRVPSRLGVATSCGIYTFTGDWKLLMFGVPAEESDPLIKAHVTETAREGSPA